MILGLGTDIVDCRRIQSSIERYGKRFIERVCTEDEIAYCMGMADPVPHVAARFAAKEAARKALGRGPALNWHDVEVVREDNGFVFLRFYGKALQGMKDMGVSQSHLSVAHEKSLAVATVILERDTNPEIH